MKKFWKRLKMWQKSALILAIIVVLIGSVWFIFQVKEGNVPPEYDLSDEFFKITTDKDTYRQGETVRITITNVFNQSLHISLSGCEGGPLGFSKYTDGKWVEFPRVCGKCQQILVKLTMEPKQIEEFEWNQYLYPSELTCEQRIASPGWYRVWMRARGNQYIISYSKPFRIL